MHKFWGIVFGVIMSAALGLFLISPLVGWWLPLNVSSFGGDVDFLFYLILGITAFFFVLTEAMLVYNIFKFSWQPGRKAPPVHGNHTLELVWTIVPGIILVVISFSQIGAWNVIKMEMPRRDKDTQQLEVVARQWEWRLRYPSADRLLSWQSNEKDARAFANAPNQDDVQTVNELHVCKGQKVLIHLRTRDVLHSFYLPQLRLKQDAVPARTIPVWFLIPDDYNTKKNAKGEWQDGYDPRTQKWAEYDAKADRWSQAERIWELACAEYCGSRHSFMRGKLYVHESKEDLLDWLRHAEQQQREGLPARK